MRLVGRRALPRRWLRGICVPPAAADVPAPPVAPVLGIGRSRRLEPIAAVGVRAAVRRVGVRRVERLGRRRPEAHLLDVGGGLARALLDALRPGRRRVARVAEARVADPGHRPVRRKLGRAPLVAAPIARVALLEARRGLLGHLRRHSLRFGHICCRFLVWYRIAEALHPTPLRRVALVSVTTARKALHALGHGLVVVVGRQGLDRVFRGHPNPAVGLVASQGVRRARELLAVLDDG